MKKITRNDAAQWLKTQKAVCILTHVRPDGDTIGSAAALCIGLRKIGVDAWILKNPEPESNLQFLLKNLETEEPKENAVIVSVDVASPGMMFDASKAYLDKLVLRIDHHGMADSFSEMELVDPGAGACGEIIWDILNLMGIEIDDQIAVPLYVAVTTDTGCFRYANTTAHSYETVAACAKTGADLYPLTEMLFVTNTFGKLKMQSWIIENAEFFCDNRGAVVAIPLEVEKTVTKEDMESLSGLLRTISGVQMAATIRQKSENTVKVSLRAVPGWDCGAVCAQFGGGGHKGAAGASIEAPMDQAKEMVKQALIATLEAK